jgi:hypothetical protein
MTGLVHPARSSANKNIGGRAGKLERLTGVLTALGPVVGTHGCGSEVADDEV